MRVGGRTLLVDEQLGHFQRPTYRVGEGPDSLPPHEATGAGTDRFRECLERRAYRTSAARRRAVKAYAAPVVSGKTEQARFQSDRFSEMVGCFDMLNGNVPYYDGLGGRVTTLDRADEPKPF
jgi:hypothetical protein